MTKSFGDTRVVDNVNLIIPKKSIFGLLGPNGAGKTSIIRMITSIIKIDEGQILFDGEILGRKHMSQIGYLPEERGLYKKMKVKEHLIYLSQIRGYNRKQALTQVEYWMERLKIEDWSNKRIEELSKGMQQKIQFIATVLHDPKLIILDEPFSGLDPINTNLIKSEILELFNKGTSVIFSTHRMDQIEEICHEIALINRGELILHGSLKEIKNNYKKNIYRIDFDNSESPPALTGFNILEKGSNHFLVSAPNRDNRQQLLKTLGNYNGHVTSIKETLPSLDEIYITAVNERNHV